MFAPISALQRKLRGLFPALTRPEDRPEARRPRRKLPLITGALLGLVFAVSYAVTTPQTKTNALGTREYWIAAEPIWWNVAPGVDRMTGQSIPANQATYAALRLRAYSPNWASPLPDTPPLGLAGPLIEAEVGDTVVVHFKNSDNYYWRPHSLHTHGLQYDSANNGSYMASAPSQPGTAIPYGGTYTYTWRAEADSVGIWPYHDHSKDTESNVELGLYGAVRVYDPNEPRPNQEFYVFFNNLRPNVSGMSRFYSLINGMAYMGNAPTVYARQGELVRWNVIAIGSEFHTFHVHGHRWLYDNKPEDTHVTGPFNSFAVQYVENNPGMWMYHCHVHDHLQSGMAGEYVVLGQ